MGLLILMIGIGAVGAMLFTGKLIATYGSHRVAMLCGILFAPTLPLIVLAPSVWLAAPMMLPRPPVFPLPPIVTLEARFSMR